jgi:hypothetical protein
LLPSGTYSCRLTTQGRSFVQPIVISRWYTKKGSLS